MAANSGPLLCTRSMLGFCGTRAYLGAYPANEWSQVDV
jgi:hypothetical protein